VALGLGGVLLTGAVLTGVAQWKTGSFADTAQRDAEAATTASVDQLARGVSRVVDAQGTSIQQAVDSGLQTTTYVAKQQGGLAPGGGSVTWTATNQLTQDATQVELPRFEVGGQWLGQNTDPAQRTPFVDDAVDLVGGTVTVF